MRHFLALALLFLTGASAAAQSRPPKMPWELYKPRPPALVSSASSHDCAYVAPFFQGTGGLVVRPSNARSMDVTLHRADGATHTETLYARDDGLVVQLLTSEICLANGSPVQCRLSVTGVEAGGWYWVNGDRNAALAPLVCESQLDRSRQALNPGGVDATPSEWGGGTLVLHHASGLMGIVPHLVGGASSTPSDPPPNDPPDTDSPDWQASVQGRLGTWKTGPRLTQQGSGGPTIEITGDGFLDAGSRTDVEIRSGASLRRLAIGIGYLDTGLWYYYEFELSGLVNLPVRLDYDPGERNHSRVLAAGSTTEDGNTYGPLADHLFTIKDPGDPPIQFHLDWRGNVDLDLIVIEPSGEEISWENPRSRTGGRLSRDANADCSGPGGNVRETIEWPSHERNPPAGRYEVSVELADGCGDTSVVFHWSYGVGRQGSVVLQQRFSNTNPQSRHLGYVTWNPNSN